jgi:cyclopropane fatty-acyl-phospholipid synthase-like methyltransferase
MKGDFMPKLNTKLHLDMLSRGKHQRKFVTRLRMAIDVLQRKDIYGLEWGDPEQVSPLSYVREHFLAPYVKEESTILEIGPGGGRWTRYMVPAKKIIAVDYHQELLDELKLNFDLPNIVFVKNNGDDFPGIEDGSVDLLFTFGVFVHLDIDIIDRYLKNMKRLLHSKSNVVIQYSDKRKPLAKKQGPNFSENNPDIMEELVLKNGFSIYEEDTYTMWHSSVIRFGI